ncbi:tRNA pseudouridine(38-40) synthase TruA [Chromohalobacter beijerinckii]|uniref:tRNA pseudouridine synthase A n=1 Tax=Chromohalobacter beijerinckii TaxID=86179 RepID=A0ABV8XJU8_9GAMM|nr:MULTISPECIES: tRNA pseudouridine(38-40) synthase TruA [Chromohalobacter]MCK0764426.1 tRNA pseudouridine(38-40) synthase TruA [Chromohalobacter beijerinckii]
MAFFEFQDDHQPLEGRIALGVEYDGSAYCGWQRLTQAPSVQAALEAALSKIANTPVQALCSGRTDTGVHATRQIVHFDAPVPRTQKAWLFGANAKLPRDIAVRWVVPVADDFHARLSALARRYRYVILNQPSRPVLERANATWCREPLDAERMHAAAQALIGEQDFSSFRAAGCQSKSSHRHVHFIEVRRYGPMIVIDIQANAFLHHMIRNIAGALVAVGRGDHPTTYPGELLALRDRTQGNVTAPGCGLHFVDVYYDERFQLPQEPLGPNMLAFVGEWSGERTLPDSEWARERRQRRVHPPRREVSS